MTRRSASIHPTESQEQCAVIEWASYDPLIFPFLISIPNGAHLAGDYRKRVIQMARLKREGLKDGVSDLLLALPMHGYYGLWIEMKRVKRSLSKVAPEQLDWLDLMAKVGYAVALCYGANEAIETIKRYRAGNHQQNYRGQHHDQKEK